MDSYVVAYLDLLGSEKKIENDKDYLFFNAVKHLYHDVLSLLDDVDAPHVRVKVFSDNIVFARKVTDNLENKIVNLHQMTCIAAMFQLYALVKCNFMLKGGISLGEFYVDDTMIWGKGLVEAFKLESDKKHFHPTIHIGGYAKDIILTNRNRFPVVSGDNEMFIDYLQMTEVSSDENVALELHRYAVLSIFKTLYAELSNDSDSLSDSLKRKMDFLGSYHNRKCREKNAEHLLIDGTKWLQQFVEADYTMRESGKTKIHFTFGIPQGLND